MKSLVRALHEIPSAFDFVAEKKNEKLWGGDNISNRKKAVSKNLLLYTHDVRFRHYAQPLMSLCTFK